MSRTAFGRKSGNGTTNGATDLKAAPASGATGTIGAPMATVREVKPSVEQVRQKAFELYQARAKAGRPGNSATDWLEAERQLKAVPPHSAR